MYNLVFMNFVINYVESENAVKTKTIKARERGRANGMNECQGSTTRRKEIRLDSFPLGVAIFNGEAQPMNV